MLKKVAKYGLMFFGLVLLIGICNVELPSLHGKYIYSKVSTQVVRLVHPKNHKSGGTGFQITAPSGERFVLTNRHVCLGTRENNTVDANFPDDTGRFYKLYVKEISKTTDLCLLTPLPDRKGVSIASSVQLQEEIGVVGHPHLQTTTLSKGMLVNYQTIPLIVGTNLLDEECEEAGGKNVVVSMISIFGPIQLNVCLAEVEAGRTTAVTYPGNSGSPVVNIYGNLVGVLFAGDEMNNGYIVPLKDVKEFLKDR